MTSATSHGKVEQRKCHRVQSLAVANTTTYCGWTVVKTDAGDFVRNNINSNLFVSVTDKNKDVTCSKCRGL